MIGRLLVGLLKGLLIGALAGYGLAAAGLVWPWLAYVAAAGVGMVVSLVAGKPIWADDSRIQVGLKAAAGAILAPALMWLVRSFVVVGLPFDVHSLPALASLSTEGLTLGTFSVTSLALVAAVLSAFFDADNQPGAEDAAKPAATAPHAKRRVEVNGTASSAEAPLSSTALGPRAPSPEETDAEEPRARRRN